LFSLTYDLWNEIIHDVIEAHTSLFEAMHKAADEIKLSKGLVEDLKSNGIVEVTKDHWNFFLQIELLDDMIEGFKISLIATESMETFERSVAMAALDHGTSLEDIESFELENGLELNEEIFETMEESLIVKADVMDEDVIFELVIFDSQDLDNSRKSDFKGSKILL
jgi:5'(3')-deoxyribonucleotidase